jgi:SSS family solute:Na+ symporter
MSNALSTIDSVIVGTYLVGMLVLGVFVGRRHRDSADYFLAGRRMKWPFIGLSLFASNISSTTLVGLAGDAYATGISVYNYEWMAAVVLVFFVIFLLPQLLRSRVFTMPEFLERRYDGRARTYFSALTIFLNIFVDTAGTLFGGALLARMVFPQLSVTQIVAIMAAVAGTYTVVGGLAAVIYTDALQAILLLVGSVVIAVVAFDQVGGWSAVVSVVDPAQLSLIRPLDDPGVPWLGLIVGVPLLGFYFWCTNQFMVQRVLSAKNLYHGRWGCLLAGLLKLPVIYIMVLPGTFALVLYPSLERPDLVYPTLLFDLLPMGLLGLALAAFIAALMSQIDSTLNSASTLVTMDFIHKRRPQLTSQQLMRIGRVVTFAFMVVAVLWAPQIERFSSLFKYLQKVLAYAVPPVVCLFLVGMFSKRATAASAWMTILVGLAGGVALFVLIEIVGVVDLHFLYVAPLLLVLCLVTQLVATRLGGASATSEQQRLVWTRHLLPGDSEATSGVAWYSNHRVLSILLLIAAAMLVWQFR